MMLICILALGFFAIPIGLTLCSLTGLVYSIKCKDRAVRIYSAIFLIIGLSGTVYTLLNISSM